ncbi:hypothetical protein Ocin01_06685 [Orchesella cincta]|uniref:Uncharacterized protein n=1 Tax=Orchesella cincta TaxID=48709 RepID=A0A1D2N409_ORCCI|nr:hypothetical protein Ocin01_06685 [Orchesella cincta]
MTSSASETITWKVFYKKSAISNKSAKIIFKLARDSLTREVFTIQPNNDFITVYSAFKFTDSETQVLQLKPVTPQDWALNFIGFCMERKNAGTCLNTLCNLHKIGQSNYQQKIVGILNNIPEVEVRQVEDLVNCESEPFLPEIGTGHSHSIKTLAAKMKNRKCISAYFASCLLLVLCGITYATIDTQKPKESPSTPIELKEMSNFRVNLSNQDSYSINSTGIYTKLASASQDESEVPKKLDSLTTANGLKSSTETAAKLDNQQLNQQRVYIRRPLEIGVKTNLLCDPEFETNLVIDPADPFEWGNVHVDCAARIHSLVIKGHLRAWDMLSIVNQTRNIRHLSIIGNDLCTASHGFVAIIDALPKIRLERLKSLEIKGMTDKESGCREVLTLVANKFRFSSKLKTLVLDDVEVGTKNKVELHRIVYNLQNYLRVFHMKNMNFHIPTFDLIFPALNLTTLHLFVQNSSSELASQSVKNLLSKEHFIKEFHSNVEIPEDDMKSTLNHINRSEFQT